MIKLEHLSFGRSAFWKVVKVHVGKYDEWFVANLFLSPNVTSVHVWTKAE